MVANQFGQASITLAVLNWSCCSFVVGSHLYVETLLLSTNLLTGCLSFLRGIVGHLPYNKLKIFTSKYLSMK